ncbi:4Fe-4S dicluster domain-containing protein [bacterium]|nr:4Fe-4S dicluster domain-containing protein [bacterium]
MRYPKLRELREAVKSLFSKPYTTRFPAVPHQPVDGFRGRPKYFEEYCVGCGACAEVCIGSAITVTDPSEEERAEKKGPLFRKLEIHYDMCAFCGNCEAHCITEKGVQLTQEYDLAVFDRKLAADQVQKELVLCDLCGGIVGCRDHLQWTAERLGTLAYGNPSLILTTQKPFLKVETGAKGGELRRPDMMKILCPKCRHEIVLKDIWG